MLRPCLGQNQAIKLSTFVHDSEANKTLPHSFVALTKRSADPGDENALRYTRPQCCALRVSCASVINFSLFSSLAQVLVVYNFACSLVSLYAVALFVFGLARNWPHSLFSRKENPVTTHAIWVYYMTKYVELLDTVFMILRHRQRQISFLHVSGLKILS